MLFLNIPVNVASCERSFSKLKLIKNYFEKHYVTRTIECSCDVLYWEHMGKKVERVKNF